MAPLGNDRWRAAFDVDRARRLRNTRVTAWVDHFLTWRARASRAAIDPDDMRVAAQVGAELIADAARARASGDDARALRDWSAPRCEATERADGAARRRRSTTRSPRSPRAMPIAATPSTCEPVLAIAVDRAARALPRVVRALPALAPATAGAHGTFATSRRGCPTIAGMGFDVLYLPPIHPIGRDQAQGPQQRARRRSPDDVGSPWAIGARRRRPQGDPSASSARSTISAAWSQRRAAQRHRDRARHRVPVRARPSVGAASIRSGSASGPTARSSTPRTRRRSTRTSIRSTSRRDDWRRCGRSCTSVFELLDRAGRRRSSASTTRTPSRSRSGNG